MYIAIQQASDTNVSSKTGEGNFPVSMPKPPRRRSSAASFIAVLNRKVIIQRITLTILLCTITMGILVPVVRLSLSSEGSNIAGISIEERMHCGGSFMVINVHGYVSSYELMGNLGGRG